MAAKRRVPKKSEIQNPSGLCKCGCGRKAPIAKCSEARSGHFIGYTMNYIAGHFRRKGPPEQEKKLCACGCGKYIFPTYAHRWRPVEMLQGHHMRGRTGARTTNWKGGRYRGQSGYIYLRINSREVLEHRHVWEKANGRRLKPNEHVHHINGKKDDNRLENLIALDASEHIKLHNADDKRRNAHSARMRELWAKPEYREKLKKARWGSKKK